VCVCVCVCVRACVRAIHVCICNINIHMYILKCVVTYAVKRKVQSSDARYLF